MTRESYQVPSRAPMHIHLGLLAAIRAAETDKLNQRRIDELTHVAKPTRNTDGKGFLDDMGFINANGVLNPDVIHARNTPSAFISLLRSRLVAALESAGCSSIELAFLNESDLHATDRLNLTKNEIVEKINGLSLFSQMAKRGEKESRIHRTRGSITLLCDIIFETPDQENLEKRFSERSKPYTKTATPGRKQLGISGTQVRDLPMRIDANGNTTHQMHLMFDAMPTRGTWEALARFANQQAASLSGFTDS